MNNIKRGDHLVSPRLGYTHHGIGLGDGHVIHYAGAAGKHLDGGVIVSTMDDFCEGSSFSVQDHPARVYSREASIERAFSRMGEADYNCLFNNCEHFAMWCIYGVASSKQAQAAIGLVSTVAAIALTPPAKAQMLRTLVGSGTVLPAMTSTAAPAIFGCTGPMLTGLAVAPSVLSIAATSSATTGVAIAGLASASAAPVVAAVGLGVALGYGVKRLVGWLKN